VVIGKGMRNGEKVRFHGMADEHPNSEPGDIVFVLQEKEHPVFTRKNNGAPRLEARLGREVLFGLICRWFVDRCSSGLKPPR
jgi:hypothetical protein